MAICLACKIEYQPKADYQKLCYKCYFESQPQKKNAPIKIENSAEEILKAERLIYKKLQDIERLIVDIEIAELRARLAQMGLNIEKILEKQNDKSTTTS